jgi:hypothetical protein
LTYSWYACHFTTGEVLDVVPLQDWSAQRHLKGGQLSGTLDLSFLDTLQLRQEMLINTQPLRCSLALDLDGRLMGEWLIWKRGNLGTGSGGIRIMGQEVQSYFTMRQIPGNTFKQREQLQIARWMVQQAIGGQGGLGKVAMRVPDQPASGQRRDRTYVAYEATIAQRLQELSEVLNGFDYYTEQEWDWSTGRRYVDRSLILAYPQAGVDNGLVLDEKGSILGFSYEEDGTLLGSEALALCGGAGDEEESDGQVVGRDLSDNLLRLGYPASQIARSWTSVTDSSTAVAHASALLKESQSDLLPPTILLQRDGVVKLGDYGLGDTMRAVVSPKPNLPLGYDGTVRVLGWTLTPPNGSVPTVALEVAEP